jgi:hypothetical protein
MLRLVFHCIDVIFFRPMGHYVRDITLLYRTLHLFIILLLYVSFECPGHTYRGFGSIFFDWGMTDCDSLGPLLQPPLVTFGAPLHALIGCLGGAPQLPSGATFPLLCTKTAPTASSPKACLVAMSRSSLVVFGLLWPSSCTRD